MEESGIVRFLYGTAPGRGLLQAILFLHLDRAAVWFLCSPLSRPVIPWYIRKHQISMEAYWQEEYRSFRMFFLREKKTCSFDPAPEHLISPCDGWLSAYEINAQQEFSIKGSFYQLSDLIHDQTLAAKFAGGLCLIVRLCASDYHHYCFVDDGMLGETHAIDGVLHSVQPIACRTYPVYTLNRRVWTLLHTDHFGDVVQTEIGALVVGGIVNRTLDRPFRRGEEKGRFELSGSTIVLFLQKDAAVLRPDLQEQLSRRPEVRVELGAWIGDRKGIGT